MSQAGKSLSKGGVYYLIYNVLNMAFPFVTGIYVARILLAQDIGSVTAAKNLAQYFVILAFLGIPTYGMREIAKVRNNNIERSKIFSELYVINFVSTITFLFCYVGLVVLVPAYRSSLALYLIAGISIALNAFNISWLYEGLEEFKFISVRNIVFKAISFILLVIMVRSPKDYLIYAGITVVGTAGNYLVNMAYAPRFVRMSFRNLNIKRHLKSIFFLVAVNLAIELYSLVDVTMMNFLSNKENIAYYKYGHSIHIMLLQVVNTFTMVLIPRVSYYYKEGLTEKFNTLVSKAFKLIILCAVPMIVGIQFTANFLIVRMYGAQYIHSAHVLKLLSVLLVVSPIGYLLGSRMLLVTNHENKMIISVGVGAIVNILGNAIMIPMMSEYGATVASLLSEFVVMIVYVNMGKRYFQLINVKTTIIKVLIAAGIMSLYLFGCSFIELNKWITLVLQIIGGVTVYALCLLVLGEETIKPYSDKVLKRIKTATK